MEAAGPMERKGVDRKVVSGLMGLLGRLEVWDGSEEWNCVQLPQDRQGKVPRECLSQCHKSALWPGKGSCLDTKTHQHCPYPGRENSLIEGDLRHLGKLATLFASCR